MGNSPKGKKGAAPHANLGQALHDASKQGNIRLVEQLLDVEAPVNWRNPDHLYVGQTPLFAAAAFGHLDVVRKLIAAGADPTLKNAKGDTALTRAEKMGNRAVVQYLEEVMQQQHQEAAIARQKETGELQKEALSREQENREQAARENASREQASRDQASREKSNREQAAREKASHEEAAREKAAREKAAREKAAREQAARDQASLKQKAAQLREKPISLWSMEDAQTWLVSMGKAFENQLDRFAEGGVDGSALMVFTDFTDFQSMGFNQAQSKQLWSALQLLKDGKSTSPPASPGGRTGSQPDSPRGNGLPAGFKVQTPRSNPTFSGKPTMEWTVEDIEGWLSSLGAGFAKAIPVFTENAVDGQTLSTFDQRDLEGFGISPGQAKIIIQKFTALASSASPAAPAASPPGGDYGPVAVQSDGGYGVLDLDRSRPLDLTKLKMDTTNELGRGNFGVVYSGDVGEKRVAVKKVLYPDPASKGKVDKEIDKELKTWQSIPPHPHVASLLGVIEVEGSKCIVMEFYDGGTLKEELDRSRIQNLVWKKRKTLSLLLGIAQGMKHLHDHNIVHRDLAARNILFGNSRQRDEAIIADFGLSREVQEGLNDSFYKMESQTALPLPWLPPETLLTRTSSPKSDVWSFGVVVWEVITQGMKPLNGLPDPQFYIQASNGGLRETLLGDLDQVEDVDPDLVQLVSMCLIHNAEKRPSSGDVVLAIENMLKGGHKAMSSRSRSGDQ